MRAAAYEYLLGQWHNEHAFLAFSIDDGHLTLGSSFSGRTHVFDREFLFAGTAVHGSAVVTEGFYFLGSFDFFDRHRVTFLTNKCVAVAFLEFLDILHGGSFFEDSRTLARRRGGNSGDKARGDRCKNHGFKCCFHIVLFFEV